MKKALVTGAAGFIGSHVVKELLDLGVEVRGFIRPGESQINLNGLELERIEGDVLDKEAVNKAVKGVDTVFHLAAIYAIWMKDFKPLWEVNLQGSRNILWACMREKTKRVVYTSSIAGIGLEAHTKSSQEETPYNLYDSSPYIFSKYLSQQEALGFAQNGLDLVVVNPAMPFGPGDVGPTPTGKTVLDFMTGKHLFTFKGGFNAVDVRDVAKGHVLAAQKGRTGEKYLLAGENNDVRTFGKIVNRIAKRRLGMLPIPTAVMKTATRALTLLSDNITNTPPLSTPDEITYFSKYPYFDVSKAKKELGYSPRPIEESIKDSVEWFKEHGYA